MKNKLVVYGLVTLVVSLSALIVVSSTLAQVKKGKSRPLQTKHLMAGLVKPHCGAIKKELDATPADEEAWESVEIHASLLNEVSYVLMADGRCPDGVWAQAATKALRDGSASVIAACKSTDLDAAKKAFGAMTKACKSCHDKHKKKD